MFQRIMEDVMPESREEWITKRAYEIWELAGRPDGLHESHWAQATAEWEGRTPAPDTPRESFPAAWDGKEREA